MAELGRPTAQEAIGGARIPVVAVLDNVRSMHNVGSFFRTCDAFAIEQLVLCGITATPPDREIHKTALGAELTVPWSHSTSAAEAVGKLRDEGYTVLAVEQVTGATMLDAFTPDATKKYALVFGNEVEGVSQSVIDRCDGAIEIPQAGAKHSLNVAVSGGVVLWSFFCAYRKQL
jgi:tRNA G18 (ribose-2'-O)-methylase SpoU